MSTIIYPSPIFGPVLSRRLGVSLGINLMPSDGKVCTFDCIYCECGFNSERRPHLPRPSRQDVSKGLEAKLKDMKASGTIPDVLTFAGNGEPTAHPEFTEIIDDTIVLRNRYCPDAKISVLSNATMLHKENVHDALMRVDNNIQKLDTVDIEYIKLVDRPQNPTYNVEKIVDQMKKFDGHVIVQTMFMTGDYNGVSVDNTTEQYIQPWIDALKAISPEKVMIYTIDRETPAEGLKKASRECLDEICSRVKSKGIPCSASY